MCDRLMGSELTSRDMEEYIDPLWREVDEIPTRTSNGTELMGQNRQQGH